MPKVRSSIEGGEAGKWVRGQLSMWPSREDLWVERQVPQGFEYKGAVAEGAWLQGRKTVSDDCDSGSCRERRMESDATVVCVRRREGCVR